jgi:hypothetical protein
MAAAIYSLDFARLGHSIHIDADDACPLCIADEIEAANTAKIEALRLRDPIAEPDGGRLLGQLMTAAYSRLDLAEMLREGQAELIEVERSKAWGLSITAREVRA